MQTRLWKLVCYLFKLLQAARQDRDNVPTQAIGRLQRSRNGLPYSEHLGYYNKQSLLFMLVKR